MGQNSAVADPGPQSLCSGETVWRTSRTTPPTPRSPPRAGQVDQLLMCPSPHSFCPPAGGPREAAPVYPHSSFQPDHDLSSHVGHLLSFLQVEGRPLLPRATHLPLVPCGAGSIHPRGGDLVLLFTPVSSLCTHSWPHPGTAPWSAEATKLWSLSLGPTPKLPERHNSVSNLTQCQVNGRMGQFPSTS